MRHSRSPGFLTPRLPSGLPFPIKSPAWAAHVSPWTILLRASGEIPLSDPGRGVPLPVTFPVQVKNAEAYFIPLLRLRIFHRINVLHFLFFNPFTYRWTLRLLLSCQRE